ncbi:MAG: hypothetical protein SR3Q1_07200 [Quinella sp. 3Q1]|nr:hypothetical protein [Quinella sp. 3Q1]
MAEKFAFEYGKVSIIFSSTFGLGDAVIARKVFEAIIELVPDCVVDFFYETEAHKKYAEAFYSDIKNLNRLLNRQEYDENLKKYDLALCVAGNHAIFFEHANAERLHALAPELCLCLDKIEAYNRENVYGLEPWKAALALRNMISAQILNKNYFHFLSCYGALPIRDKKINLPLAPEFKPIFDSFKLGKYITIYTNIERDEARPKVKTWPMKYLVEYVSRMKNRFPSVEIIQVGGSNDVLIENVDREALGCDLELTKYILANSLLHVGCEGGLIHLATFLGTKCLVLFGSSAVEYFGYNQNINLVSEVCRPCMYILAHDFSICMLGAKEPPCMLSHTPQKVCEVTCNYLNRLGLKNNA